MQGKQKSITGKTALADDVLTARKTFWRIDSQRNQKSSCRETCVMIAALLMTMLAEVMQAA